MNSLFARKTVLTLFALNLTGCIAPLPVKSVDDPWIRGTVTNNGAAVADVEVRLDHEDNDACENPGLQTVTDANGKFAFDGKMRTWTWLGWANNHYVHGCVLTADGPRSFGIKAVNDPQSIDISCDIANPPREMCSYSCDTEGLNDRC